jgi:hypothetical protein
MREPSRTLVIPPTGPGTIWHPRPNESQGLPAPVPTPDRRGQLARPAKVGLPPRSAITRATPTALIVTHRVAAAHTKPWSMR